MNKEIKISITDLCIGYGCAAFLMYAIGGIAYSFGKAKAKIEVSENIREFMKNDVLPKKDV